MVFRKVLDKAGYFDEELFFGEDWDLWIRLARISWVDFTPEAVVGIRAHAQSATRRAQPDRALRFFRQKIKVYDKWQSLLAIDNRLRTVLRKEAVEAILPLWRLPLAVIAFYRSLASSGHPLESKIFRNIVDFAFMLSLRITEILWQRLKRKVGVHEQ
jgi:GT2 family glycosyltransferase